MSRPRPALLFLVLAVLSLIWGSTWLAIRINVQDFPPLRAAGLRFLLAAGLIALVAGRRRFPSGQKPGEGYWLILSLVLITLPYACVYWGEQHIPSGLTAVLFATYPLFVAFLAHATVPGDRLTLSLLAGITCGLAGLTFIFRGEMSGAGPEAIAGSLLILVSAVSSATGTVMVKRRLAHLDPLLINLRPMLYGGALLMALSLTFEADAPWSWSLRGVLALVYLAFFGSAIAFGIYFWLMRSMPISRLSFIVYVTPLIALALGVLIAEEQVTGELLLGTGLIISGIAVAQRRR